MQPPKQDHYEIARDAALRKLNDDLDAARLETLGARRDPESGRIVLPTLCWELEVLPEPFEMCLLPERDPVAISWQIIALNYLAAPQPQPPRGFVSFADIPDGRSYLSAFNGRICQRLGHTAGRDADAFEQAARRLGAEPIAGKTTRCIFRVFPLFELEVVRCGGGRGLPGLLQRPALGQHAVVVLPGGRHRGRRAAGLRARGEDARRQERLSRP